MSFILIFSVLAKRFAGKSISDMTYLVLSGTLNVNSVSHSAERLTQCSELQLTSFLAD